VKSIKQHVYGSLLSEGGRHGLLLEDERPSLETADSLYLRYAIKTLGTEKPVLPAFVLDDWGGEIKGLELYAWLREFGDQFPRAELFGFDLSGQEIQYFLRELELFGRPLCYAYPAKNTSLADGMLIETIMLPDSSVTGPSKIRRPSHIGRPLASARVAWWTVKPSQSVLPAI
jgi:hypothetical protein